MRNHFFIVLVVVSCVLACQAGAQGAYSDPRKGSWETVENLPRGTGLAVKVILANGKMHTMHCAFHEASETELVCGHWSDRRPAFYPVPRPVAPDRYVFARGQIQQVRFEVEDINRTDSATLGSMGGAIVGGVIGFNCCHNPGDSPRQAGAAAGALLGSIVGAIAGHVFPFVRGQVLYEL
ncbi:MAG TPA: hypothetical protein VGF88_11530 [Acidobacteriaceae bacterium]|jgi:hypothetical protein